MNNWMLLLVMLVATALAACGPAQPSETVDALVANPERIKEIQRLCKEERAKVGDELCLRAAEAAKRRFFGDRPEQKNQ
ncbi:lipoprotein [Alicycliphilus sp. B1]|nr:lipoprotein [Alicycliphilus sp. B1]